MSTPEPPSVPSLQAPSALALLRVFRHRNYRLFFSGQLVSLMGTWMQSIAQGWLVYALTHSPFLLGVTSFAGQVPVFFMAAFGGVIADRVDRRRALMVTQSTAMILAAVLAALTLSDAVKVGEVIALALCMGLVNSFDIPTRQAFTVDMVGREDLRNAISLNSVMFNLARIIGPTAAGLLVAAAGEGVCFALNAVSYGAVLTSLFLIRVPERPQRAAEHPLREIRAGAVYSWRTREIRNSLLLVAVCAAFGASYLALMPAVARDVLHQGSAGLGYLMGSVGLGALIGAYALARVPDIFLSRTPMVSAGGFGLSLIVFAHSHVLWLSMALLLPTSFFLMLLGGSTNTIIQTVAHDHVRGRVISFYTMSFMGMMPWGSLVLGWLAGVIGVGEAVTIGGIICMLAAALAWQARGPAGVLVPPGAAPGE
ncbi:MAG: MFS transporter [Alphaproteobacteria bacterium]|nr:MFS transporter [Alphaproteobacteria bacterium]